MFISFFFFISLNGSNKTSIHSIIHDLWFVNRLCSSSNRLLYMADGDYGRFSSPARYRSTLMPLILDPKTARTHTKQREPVRSQV